MTKNGIILIFLLFFGLPLFAGHVTVQDAKVVATNFLFERLSQHQQVPYSSLKIRETFVKTDNQTLVYYIFNFSDLGWVIVSADDAVRPILAYSFLGSYSETDQPPQFSEWMKQYAGQIRFAIRTGTDTPAVAAAEWEHLRLPEPGSHSAFRGREVQPFITSSWNQSFPYNEMCPVDPGGSGVHAVVGCVPVAMGQIMYYYRWPETGAGSYSYYDSTYGTQQVDFGNTTYKWNNMKASASKRNDGIAQLLYHLGVSCDLVYGPDGSGMYNHKAAYSLRTYFKYSPQTQYIFRDSTSLDWDSTIIAHLDRRMPLYYAGWSVPNSMGHAFVCDGYQGTDFFHFNFGWSGSYDGYFYIDNLVPGGNNFNLAQELIINCYPDTVHYTYPVNCPGDPDTLNYNEGTITDGSGPLHPYRTPASCSWLIRPQDDKDSVSYITLSFNDLDINSKDSVIIHDGGSQDSPVLGSFTGNTLPASLTSTGNMLLVRFKAVGDSPAPGWSLTYSSVSPVWCKGTTILTADTAEVSDGSYRFRYHDNSNCRWKLLPANTDTLTIYFRFFDTEAGADVLRIYDLDSLQLLATLSGHYDELNPPPPVTSPSGKMFLVFNSNGSVTGDGWEFFYPKSTLGLTRNAMSRLKVYPNPAQDRFSIDFYNEKNQNMTLALISASGMQIFSESQVVARGHIIKSYGTGELVKGIYFLRIMSENAVVMRKIVIE